MVATVQLTLQQICVIIFPIKHIKAVVYLWIGNKAIATLQKPQLENGTTPMLASDSELSNLSKS